MTLDFGLSELVPTLEEFLLIRQAQAEAAQNAAFFSVSSAMAAGRAGSAAR